MVLASVALLAFAPLSLSPGFRTFPEIAALVGETPTEVKCDPTIAHRAVFVRAGSISPEGLVQALGLKLVPSGSGRTLKAADAAREREWEGAMRRAISERYARMMAFALAAAESRAALGSEKWEETFIARAGQDARPVDRPKESASRVERRRSEDLAFAAKARMVVNDDDSEARVRALAAFSPEIPDELVERGVFHDTLPLASLPEPTIRSLRAAYPGLRGGMDTLVLRRRTMYGTFGVLAQVGIVDPGVIVRPGAPIQVWGLPSGMQGASVGRLLQASALGEPKLRGWATEIDAARREETEGRTLVDRYAAETPPNDVPDARSLSQVAEAWAAKGHDVLMELDPGSEDVATVFERGRLRADGDWSPRIVEGVLVLRPLLRPLGRRRYPLAALLALEATGETAVSARRRPLGWPSSLAIDRYIRHAGPDDRWGWLSYRGWPQVARSSILDWAAGARRVRDLVPATTLEASDRVLEEMRARGIAPWRFESGMPPPPPDRIWKQPLTELPSAARAAITREFRADALDGSMIGYSPEAMAVFLREGTLEVTVGNSARGYERAIRISAPEVPPFGRDVALFGG